MNLHPSEHDERRGEFSPVLPALPSHFSKDVPSSSKSLPAKRNLLRITIRSGSLVMIVLIFCCLSFEFTKTRLRSLQHCIRTPRSQILLHLRRVQTLDDLVYLCVEIV